MPIYHEVMNEVESKVMICLKLCSNLKCFNLYKIMIKVFVRYELKLCDPIPSPILYKRNRHIHSRNIKFELPLTSSQTDVNRKVEEEMMRSCFMELKSKEKN